MRRAISLALAGILLASCAAASAPAPVAPTVAAGDAPVNLAKGQPAPDDGVWISVALNTKLVYDLTKWEAGYADCETRLTAKPADGPPWLWIAAGILAGGAAGATVTLLIKK